MGSDFERQRFEKHRLERVAFGKPSDAADSAAAQDALRQLVAYDQAAVASAAVEPQAPEPAEPGETNEGDDTGPSIRPRRYLPLVAGAALIVALAVGFTLGRVIPAQTASHPPNPTTSLFARSAPSTTFQRNPSASSSAALAELARPQTSSDVLITPDLTGTLGIEEKSLHRVLQVPAGITLWVGRTTTEICMIFTGGAGTPYAAGASCATPREFEANGLELQRDGYSWAWDGTTFGTTSTG